MFKKLKDKIEEEFKQAPLKFPVSVQQLAQVISPSPSVNSLTENNASSSLAYPTDMPNVSTDFFSIGGDDESQDGIAKMQLTLQNVELTATSPSNMTHNMSRSRRSSLSSVTSEASSLFPIYESGLNQNFMQSDLESEMEDGMSGQLDRVSKEQMYQTFKKVLNRYNKYKGRYTDLLKHYKELQHENFKTKNVLQESQDKALRRMAELREQCQLEQKAKAHLEESLRNDVEERDHIIDTLKTKISLLSGGDNNVQLIDFEGHQGVNSAGGNSQANELFHLKSQNEDLQKEVEKLKKIKETACHIIHRCDTTINEATADIQSDNLKKKMSELKLEIQKMKSENENLSHLLSKNIIGEDDKKSGDGGGSGNGSFLADSEPVRSPDEEDPSKTDEKDKKIEKLNNLLLKCKDKINGLTSELKAKDLVIEDNQKRMKDLKEEMDLMRTKEEENALSMAENKKAIHEELDAKEKQIKALTKELKAKGNEYIKEKDETIKSYENKIRDLAAEHAKEMKTKTEQNQKLLDDLKAKEIVSGSLDKLKTMEDGFANLLEILRGKNSSFEAIVRSKTSQIESAQARLDERISEAGKRVEVLLQANRKPIQTEMIKQERRSELEGAPRGGSVENVENFHVVEKLKSDVANLCKKLGILESELEEAKKDSKAAGEERERWRERCEKVEKECEKLRADFREKAEKNTELGRALTDKNEQIKKAESEREMLQNVSREKIETESKLKEYIEKYGKLESENRTLQNDLMEKCGKLLKDLNESKERVKSLEEEGKAKTAELDSVKRKHSIEEKKKCKEIQELKREWENLKADTSLGQQRFTEELEKLKSESDELRLAAAETTKVRNELEEREKELAELKAELSTWETRKGLDLEELEAVKKERILERESNERLKNELEALRGNLKGELKEKEEKSILVDKLTQECNLLMGEIENLKKVHSNAENKLENELKVVRDECAIQRTTLENLKEQLADNQRTLIGKEKELEEARRKMEGLREEKEKEAERQNEEERLRLNELSAEAERVKRELEESEKSRREMSEKMFKLTNDMNEAFGELQLKQSELETLRKTFKSLQGEMAEKEKAFDEEKTRLLSENENKLNVLKNEIKYINTKHEEDIGNFEENLNSEMKEANEKMAIAEKTSAELLDKLERITNERDELKAAEEEKNLKITELENCMVALKAELDDAFNETRKDEEKNSKKHNEEIKEIVLQYDKEIAERDEEIEELKAKLESAEGDEELKVKHGQEIREIVMQYDSEIAQRDEEIDGLKSKCSDHEDTLRQLNSVKEELKNLKRKLAESENKVEENHAGESQPEMEESIGLEEEKMNGLLAEERAKMEAEKEKAVALEREIWETRLAAAVEKYEKEASQRKMEISNQKRGGKHSEDLMEEINLEPAAKVSMNSPLQTGSTNLLEKQLIEQAEEMKELKKQYKKEIMELKKVSSKRKTRKNGDSSENTDWYYTCGGLENDTEHEYLRNILYEYMMGKEQLVLAKVLSAIVKFNEEQTHNVLEKEQQRQTLLGQLGLL